MGDVIVGIIALYIFMGVIPGFLKKNLPGLFPYYMGIWIFSAVVVVLVELGH
jgi:hypothetical protein